MRPPDAARREIESIATGLTASAGGDAFEYAGLHAAAAFAGFAKWIDEETSTRKIESVFLLSREGPFLEAILQRAGVEIERIDVLEVSRVSTFLPSVEAFDNPTMMRIWERFPLQTPESMLKSLDLSCSAFESLLDRFELRLDEEIFEPWNDQRVAGFLADRVFVETAIAARDEARAKLLDYLDQKGYFRSEQVALVDVGWRGTIQDSLARLAPAIHSTGLLFAYRPADLPQYANTTKAGFLAGRRADGTLFGQELRMAASPLEMLCTCPGGSTIGYERIGGRIAPVRRPIEAEEVFLRREVERFQTSVLAAVGAVTPAVRSLTGEDLRAVSSASLKDVLFDPAPEIVRVFEDFQLDASIGGGSLVRRPQLRSIFTSAGRRGLKELIKNHGWPHAIARRFAGRSPYGLARKAARRIGRAGRWLV